jgi:uncharacterized membrane protein
LLRQAGQLTWQPVLSTAMGYVQSIAEDGLLDLARALPGVVRLAHCNGGFVARRAVLLSVAG